MFAPLHVPLHGLDLSQMLNIFSLLRLIYRCWSCSLGAHVADTDRMVNEINVQRSLRQQDIATKLQELEADWTAQVCLNILQACVHA